MRGKIEYVFDNCGACILTGCLLLLLSLAFGWVKNSDTALICLAIALIPTALMVPSIGIKSKVFTSCDFLAYIHQREKIRNDRKESKNHK
jgi:hypothetical protein